MTQVPYSKASWDKASAILDPLYKAMAEDVANGASLSSATLAEFLAWNEISNKLHPTILAHLKTHPDALKRAAPTAWIKASRLLAHATAAGPLLIETALACLLPQPEANKIFEQARSA